MLAGTIKQKLMNNPFEGFIITMNDGRKFKITHPDYADVSPKGTKVIIYFDDDSSIDLSSILIASVENVKTKAKSR
jgi:hypothetical protein